MEKKSESYFWISWYQPTDDHRPITYPPNASVLGWWCSGHRGGDNAATMVSVVKAKDEESAKEVIKKDWPEADGYRFCEKKENLNLSDRFPLDGWSRGRFEHERKKDNPVPTIEGRGTID